MDHHTHSRGKILLNGHDIYKYLIKKPYVSTHRSNDELREKIRQMYRIHLCYLLELSLDPTSVNLSTLVVFDNLQERSLFFGFSRLPALGEMLLERVTPHYSCFLQREDSKDHSWWSWHNPSGRDLDLIYAFEVLYVRTLEDLEKSNRNLSISFPEYFPTTEP